MQLSALIVNFNLDGKSGKLHKPLTMSYEEAGLKKIITVPAGFYTDFASIPKAVRSMIPQLGLWTASAIVHDASYWAGASWGMDRKKADMVFLKLMEEAGVSWWKRQVIHKALRGFGMFAWNAHRKLGHKASNMGK